MTAILSVCDLEKTFGSIVAARDITLDVPAEQTVGIIGLGDLGGKLRALIRPFRNPVTRPVAAGRPHPLL